MEDLQLLLTLAATLSGALLLGYATHRLGLSPIAGYLLAGVALGPTTPGFVANAELAEQLAEVGVILLMFGVGLQFHLHELLAVRRIVVPGALVAASVATALGFVSATFGGLQGPQALVFGLTLSVASTVVLVRILSERRELHTTTGHIAVGWLVVEDLLTVVVLVLLPTLAGGDVSAARLTTAIGTTVLKIAALLALAAVVGQRIVPAILDRVAATRSRELFVLTILAIALGIAAGSSMA
ncbi:MAG: cation:proton antiporter, partial [Vicinamibacterales bacterium]